MVDLDPDPPGGPEIMGELALALAFEVAPPFGPDRHAPRLIVSCVWAR
jgi:hypothetical protein